MAKQPREAAAWATGVSALGAGLAGLGPWLVGAADGDAAGAGRLQPTASPVTNTISAGASRLRVVMAILLLNRRPTYGELLLG